MRIALSNNHFSADDQVADVIKWLRYNDATVTDKFRAEWSEFDRLTWSGSWVDAEASKVDPEYMSWVADWIESNTAVYWEDGEPFIDLA